MSWWKFWDKKETDEEAVTPEDIIIYQNKVIVALQTSLVQLQEHYLSEAVEILNWMTALVFRAGGSVVIGADVREFVQDKQLKFVRSEDGMSITLFVEEEAPIEP